MLVLHVHDRLSALGGADWHLLSLLDGLPDGIRAAALFGRQDGSVPNPPPLSGGYHFIKKIDKKAPFAAEEEIARAVEAKVRELRPDIIHVHNIPNPRLMTALAGSGRAVMTVQDHRYFCPGRGKVREDGTLCSRKFGPECRGCFRDELYFRRLMELVEVRLAALEKFDRIIVLSRYMKDQLVQAGLNPGSIRIIPPFVHGLNTAFTPPPDRADILFAGRIVWAKGIFDLLEAMTLLPGDVRLIVAGSGTMDDNSLEEARRFGVENRVFFTGWTAHRAMAEAYRRCRLLAVPSRWQEPFGIVGLEAAALGRPVAAYRAGGVDEWLKDGVNGLMASSGNVRELADVIGRILSDRTMAREMGQAGRALVREKFSRQPLMDLLTRLYRELAS